MRIVSQAPVGVTEVGSTYVLSTLVIVRVTLGETKAQPGPRATALVSSTLEAGHHPSAQEGRTILLVSNQERGHLPLPQRTHDSSQLL